VYWYGSDTPSDESARSTNLRSTMIDQRRFRWRVICGTGVAHGPQARMACEQ